MVAQNTKGSVLMNIVKTHGLTKRYGEADVVSGLDMEVAEGRVYGFIGPNGAGKSTTLKMLLGLARPTAGEIELFGKPFNSRTRAEILKDIGSLIEAPSCYGHLTGEENLEILRVMLDLPRKNIDEALSIVRLENQRRKKVSAYSLGMKQRLGLAGALLSFPKLLILDEPTNGLDPAGIQEMRELIRSLPEKYAMTVIVSSHLLSEVDRLADDVGIISDGRMKYQGPLDKLHGHDESRSLEEIFLELTGGRRSL